MSSDLPPSPMPGSDVDDDISEGNNAQHQDTQKRAASVEADGSERPARRAKVDVAVVSPLLGLPSEVRVKILGHLLCSSKPLSISCDEQFMCERREHPKPKPSDSLSDYDECADPAGGDFGMDDFFGDGWYKARVQQQRRERQERLNRKFHQPIPSYRLHPFDIAANRKLYAEGKAVLYENNTISIRVRVKPSGPNGMDDAEATVIDHSHALASEEINEWNYTDAPRAPHELFNNFHIHIHLLRNYSRLRAKQFLQDLVMNLNDRYPLSRPRKLTLVFEEESDLTCAVCGSRIAVCQNFRVCEGCKERELAFDQNAVACLGPFRFLKNVSDVSIKGPITSAQILANQITSTSKGPDLFPLYFAMLCYIQRISRDSFTMRTGHRWEELCSLDDVPENDELSDELSFDDEDDPNEFAFGEDAAPYGCPPWLLSRVRQMRKYVDEQDEPGFRAVRCETRNFISLALDDARDKLIYMYEGGRPPNKLEDEGGEYIDEDVGGQM